MAGLTGFWHRYFATTAARSPTQVAPDLWNDESPVRESYREAVQYQAAILEQYKLCVGWPTM